MRHQKPNSRSIRLANNKGRFTLTDEMLNSQVYIFDAPTYGGSGTSQYLEDFVSALELGTGTFEIFINQTDEIKCNKLVNNRERINQDEKVATTSLLSDTKRILVNTDLSENEKILFFAFNEVEGEDDGSVKKGTRIYIMQSFTRYDNFDGSFSQGEILLNRVHKFNLIKSDGKAVQINFKTKAIQPSNAKKVKITFDSFAALSGMIVQKEGNISLTSKLTDGKWQPNFMYPKTATDAGNVIWENPWVGQYRYFDEFRRQDYNATFAPQDKDKSVFDAKRTDDKGDITLRLIVNGQPSLLKMTNLIPNHYYSTRTNLTLDVLANRFNKWYCGDVYPQNENSKKSSELDMFNNITADNGLSLIGNMSRGFDWDRLDGLLPMPDKSPWDDWNGVYEFDFIHIYGLDIVGTLSTHNHVMYSQNPTPKYDFINGAQWLQVKEDIINDVPISFNSVNFIAQLPDGNLPQEPARDPNPKNWSPANDNKYLLLLPLKTTDFVRELLFLMLNDNASNNISDNWRYDTSKWLLKTFNNVGKLGKMKIPQGDSEAVNHNRVPQQAFLSKTYCTNNGWPTDNSITLELNQEEVINNISLSHYGGEFINIEWLDENDDPAVTSDGNEIPVLKYKSIQFSNRLLTKTKIIYGIT